MSLKAAFQMDEIESLHIDGDTTFALMLEAEARGHSLFYYTPEALTFDNGAVLARGYDVSVKDEAGNHFKRLGVRTIDLEDMDVVHLRTLVIVERSGIGLQCVHLRLGPVEIARLHRRLCGLYLLIDVRRQLLRHPRRRLAPLVLRGVGKQHRGL